MDKVISKRGLINGSRMVKCKICLGMGVSYQQADRWSIMLFELMFGLMVCLRMSDTRYKCSVPFVEPRALLSVPQS